MGREKSRYVNHFAWIRPESLWSGDQMVDYLAWWRSFWERIVDTWPKASSKQVLKILLGKQTGVVQFSRRNWFWLEPAQLPQWLVYADKGGPSFHVRDDASDEERWAAWLAFTAVVDKAMAPFVVHRQVTLFKTR